MKKNHIAVCCDAKGCGWSLNEKIDDAKKWHNAACPSCGHSPVLNDEDIELISGMVALRDLGLAHVGGTRSLKVPHLDIHFDTSGLRLDAAGEQSK